MKFVQSGQKPLPPSALRTYNTCSIMRLLCISILFLLLTSPAGASRLTNAAKKNQLEKVTQRLDKGDDVNKLDSRGQSALMHAVPTAHRASGFSGGCPGRAETGGGRGGVRPRTYEVKLSL